MDAIHPGYGFLAENPSFVDACERAGIVFVGPSSQTMRLLGDKIAARRLAAEAGVPVVPGEENAATFEEALAAADRLGYPVLVKAVSGGGGKGIRLVGSHDEMEAALRVAGSEAASAFGDHKLYVEKFLERVRHVEVQFLADANGNIVALGERECSIQRRHQKLIEESPSPAVDAPLRERLCAATVEVARAAGYRNAGTAEFLLDESGNFYFLEINARLQVEHPVTELVTGIDLVAEQLRIAAGERLSFGQEDVELRGWAIECRIAAEDPFRDFLPSLGRVDYVSEPAGPGIRVDSALFAGSDIPYYYDPMIAKVLAWGHDRDEAVRRMQRALAEFVVVGVDTNVPLHQRILRDPRFLAGDIHTTFLERDFEVSARRRRRREARCPAGGRGAGASTREAGTGGHLVEGRRRLEDVPAASGATRRGSAEESGRALGRGNVATKHRLKLGDEDTDVEIEERQDHVAARIGDVWHDVRLERIGGSAEYSLILDGRPFQVFAEESAHGFEVIVNGRAYSIARRASPTRPSRSPAI